MKRKILSIGVILLLISMLFVLTGCGNEDAAGSISVNDLNETDVIPDEEVSAMDELERTEIETFNSQFTSYEGSQRGSNIRTLFSTLISNAESRDGESEFIPSVEYGSEDDLTEIVYDGGVDSYVDELTSIRNRISSANSYTVELEYDENDLITGIIITY